MDARESSPTFVDALVMPFKGQEALQRESSRFQEYLHNLGLTTLKLDSSLDIATDEGLTYWQEVVSTYRPLMIMILFPDTLWSPLTVNINYSSKPHVLERL